MGVLNEPVSVLKGVGPKKDGYLRAAGIETLRDILYYFPRDYEDRACRFSLGTAPHGRRAGLIAQVAGRPVTSRIRKGFTITRVPVHDDTGRGFLVWFNNPYSAKQLSIGGKYRIFGHIERHRSELQVQSPNIEKVSDYTKGYKGSITPIYPRRGKLSTGEFERLIANALAATAGNMEDIFPESFKKAYGLKDIEFCIKNIHFPKDMDSLKAARYRLIFEELFILQFGLLSVKKGLRKKCAGVAFTKKTGETEMINALPFGLTNAQKRVWAEIKADMESRDVMNRLLQGDVGSGKTIIAALALFKVVQNGYQGALMVPTGVLAEQHFKTLTGILFHTGYNIEFLTGSCAGNRRKEIYDGISKGDIDIIIGTHSLIQEGLTFKRLGLVITDEQHRFGVRQRSLLASKGADPDILVMTATPIPRSLALILYGDMDLSVIDEMPPGRKKVKTYVIGQNERAGAYGFIEKQLKKGRQAFVICPLIEDTDFIDARSAIRVYEGLSKKYCGIYRVELLHGKVEETVRESIMRDFREGLIHILISTTVVEVGIDVPNANILLIENAERFGLAQLHQLRGRVGRGESQSYCILVNGSENDVAYKRMKVIACSNDGFFISEKDLEFRGPGDIFGIRQHGLPDLTIAQLPMDMGVLNSVQTAVYELFEHRSRLKDPEWNCLIHRTRSIFKKSGLFIDVI